MLCNENHIEVLLITLCRIKAGVALENMKALFIKFVVYITIPATTCFETVQFSRILESWLYLEPFIDTVSL